MTDSQFISLLFVVIGCGLWIVIGAAYLIYRTQRREGLRKVIMADGTVIFFDAEGKERVRIKPHPKEEKK